MCFSETPKIYAVAGEDATIPCYLPEPVEEDEATMILWYRSDIPNPIYTLDLRNVPLQTARHFPSKEMEGRLNFNINVHPPVLYITPVYKEDEGEYKCRVDLRRSRTLILQIKLAVIGMFNNYFDRKNISVFLFSITNYLLIFTLVQILV